MRTRKVAGERVSRPSKSRVVLSALVYFSNDEKPEPLVRFLDDDRVHQARSVEQAIKIGSESFPHTVELHSSYQKMMRARERYFKEFMIVGPAQQKVVDFKARGQRYRLRIRVARKNWRSR